MLVLGGRDVRALVWERRRELLEGLGLQQVLRPGAPAVALNPVHEDGVALLQATLELGLEGVVPVRRDRPYLPWQLDQGEARPCP